MEIEYYKQGGQATFQSLSFSLQSGSLTNGTWTVTIPADQVTTRGLAYYVKVTDANGDEYYFGSAANPHNVPVHGNINISVKTTPPSATSNACSMGKLGTISTSLLLSMTMTVSDTWTNPATSNHRQKQ